MFRTSKRRWLIAGLSLLLVLAMAGVAVAEDTTDGLFQQIRTVYNLIQAVHKDGADAQKFVNGAIKGGIEALGDPYTQYFPGKEYQDFLDSLNGTFSGIGAYLDIEGDYVIISQPIKGSPAEKAGLLLGDRILEANGTSLLKATTEKAVSLIRGPEGTTVTLKIERPSENRTFTVTITRAQINIPEVESKMLDGQIGYIQIATFGESAATDFYKAVDSLKAQGAKGLVLDLRGNGGGYLDAAVSIASAFIPKGQPVVWEVTKSGKTSLNSAGTLINLPVSVLVDKGSASASEILAGAIQDYGAGPLVGTQSFGKGTVQQIWNLANGDGIKITIAEYLTPKERHVHGIGLTPDYALENPVPPSEHTAPLEYKRSMGLGEAGLDVLYLQYRLADLGYKPETQGFYGPDTQQAVLDFERDHGLTSFPVVDQAFVTALNQAVAAHTKEMKLKDAQLDKAVELVKAKIR